MAVWLIANNLWSSSETPENLGVIDGVQTYRVQSLMNAYNNCASNDKITLDPDSDNFKDNRGYRIRTVVFEMEANWAVNKSIVLAGGEYRMRLDGLGIYCLILTNSAFYDVDFVRLHRPGYDAIVSLNCDFTRCIFAGCSGDLSAFYFNNAASSLTDCAFYGNLSDIRSNVAAGSHAMKFTRCVMASKYSTSYATYDDCINLYNLTQAQINAIGFIKPPKVIDPDNPGYYTDGTARTNTDWESFDLHLKPDSPYATGNSLTESDGEVLDLDGVPRKPGGAKGAYEVAKSVIYFGTDGWNGTGALSWLGVTKTLWGEYPTYLCNTVDQAVNAAPLDGIVTPDPDSASFRDAVGFPLHTVTVTMGSNLTVNKSITLAGGAYRLRLDGGGNVTRVVINAGASFCDIDFVRLSYNSSSVFCNTEELVEFRRCLVAGCKRTGAYSDHNSAGVAGLQSLITHLNAYDCAFFGCNSSSFTISNQLSVINLYRCTIETGSNLKSVWLHDTLNYYTLSNSSAHFVTPPKLYSASNHNYYTDGTPWTIDDWEGVNLHLLSPTSEYATGATSITEDEPVYDLAGNKRKVGGAKGAYEVLDDVTHWSRVFIREWKYTVEYESDDAPVIVSIGKSQNRTSTRERTLFSFRDYAFIRFQYLSSSNAWVTISESQTRYVNTEISITLKKFRVTNDSGAYAYITLYAPNDTAPSNAQVCNMNISLSLSFVNQDDLAASSVTANSVCYVDNNTIYADSASTVKKVYISGWTHVDLGDVTTTDSLVLGLGATVETSGNLTLVGETLTSDELFEKVKLVAPAEFTLKDCTVSGDLNSPYGTSIVLSGGIFNGKLPLNSKLANNVSVSITENTVVNTLSILGTANISVLPNVFLTIKQNFDVSDATSVILDSTGYVAIPYGVVSLDIFTAGENGSTSKVCYYGAGVSTISAVVTVQTAKIEFTKNAPPIPVLIERKKGNSWETVGLDANVCDVSDDEKQITFRAFDGEVFLEAEPTRRTYYLKNKQGGSFTTASDWTLNSERTIVCNSILQIPDNIFDCRF